jgi:hypothetical protein
MDMVGLRFGYFPGRSFSLTGFTPSLYLSEYNDWDHQSRNGAPGRQGATSKEDVDGRAFASPKRLSPRRPDKPGHDEEKNEDC